MKNKTRENLGPTVDIGNGYYISIDSTDIGFMQIINVDIKHPNSRWGPWFFLWKTTYCDKWQYQAPSSATKTWIRKELKNIDTGCKELNKWITVE